MKTQASGSDGEGFERVRWATIIVDLITAATCTPHIAAERMPDGAGQARRGRRCGNILRPAKQVYRISPASRGWMPPVEPFASAPTHGPGPRGPGDTVFILGAATIGAVILQHCKAGCGELFARLRMALERALPWRRPIIRAGKDVVPRVGNSPAGWASPSFDATATPAAALCLSPRHERRAGGPWALSPCPRHYPAMINQREITHRLPHDCFQFEPTIERWSGGLQPGRAGQTVSLLPCGGGLFHMDTRPRQENGIRLTNRRRA